MTSASPLAGAAARRPEHAGTTGDLAAASSGSAPPLLPRAAVEGRYLTRAGETMRRAAAALKRL
jgi:hypothetical protein